MKPVRVLEVVGNCEIGGVERHVAALAFHMRHGAQISGVVVPREGPFVDLLQEHGVPVYILPMPQWGASYTALAGLCHLIDDLQIDVVHTHYGMAHPFGQTAAALTGVAGVVTVHGAWINNEEVMMPAMYGTHLICVCEAGRTSATDAGIRPEKISVVYNGVDVQRFTPSPELEMRGRQLLDQFGIPANRPRVGFVGRLSWEKGPQHFAAAAPMVFAEMPEVTFVFVGNGDLGCEAEMRKRTQQFGDRFIFTGLIDDIPAMDMMLDIVVLTSLSEGTPLALLEAMAIGKPVIATHVGGVPELVRDEVTGLLVPAGDDEAIARAILRLLHNPNEAHALGLSAQTDVRRNFSIDAMIEHTADVLQQVYARHTLPASA